MAKRNTLHNTTVIRSRIPRFVVIFDSIGGDTETKIQRDAQDLNWTSVVYLLDTSSTHLIIRYYGYRGDINPCILPACQNNGDC